MIPKPRWEAWPALIDKWRTEEATNSAPCPLTWTRPEGSPFDILLDINRKPWGDQPQPQKPLTKAQQKAKERREKKIWKRQLDVKKEFDDGLMTFQRFSAADQFDWNDDGDVGPSMLEDLIAWYKRPEYKHLVESVVEEIEGVQEILRELKARLLASKGVRKGPPTPPEQQPETVH
jgi:hypothetical protein